MFLAPLALLLGLTLTAHSSPPECECKHYAGSAASGTSGAVVLSVVEVNEDYVIDSVAIKGLFVQHAMPSALKITLSAVPPSLGNIGSVVLKDVPTEGGGQDIRDITFADEADAPISSLLREGQAYSPAEELSTLAEGSSTQASHGGSRGSWVLRIKDLSLGAQSPILLAGWELVLCEVGSKMYLPSQNMGQSQRTPTQGKGPPEEAMQEVPGGVSVDTGNDGMADAASPVPPAGAADKTSGSAGAGFSPDVLEAFLQRLQRVGSEEEASYTSEPVLDRLMARLDDLIPDEERAGSPGEDGVFSLILANSTQLPLPTGPTVSLLESLQDLVNNTSSNSLSEGIMQQSSSGFGSGSLLDGLDILDGEGYFGNARDQAQTWYKEQLDEVNKVINEANRAIKQRSQDGGPLTDAALLPYKTGLRWLKAGISQLELLAENDLRSLGQATLTGATPSAFRINLSGVSSSLLENIRIFDGLFGDQG